MNALVRKEIRLLMPAWIAALFLTTLPVLLVPLDHYRLLGDLLIVSSVCFVLAALLLSMTPFGQEFSLGTFHQMLAQPAPRRGLWRAKIAVLTVAMISISAALLFCYRIRTAGMALQDAHFDDEVKVVGTAAVVVFAGGLWTTLLLRQVAAALWFALLVPAALLLTAAKLGENYSDFTQELVVYVVAGLYFVAGVFWARYLFLRAQDAQWTGGTISLPAWLSFGTRANVFAAAPHRKPLGALLRKEFQSHHVSLLLGAALLVSHLVAIAVRKTEYDPSYPHKILYELLGAWWLLWFGLPFLAGSAAVAEERKLGTLESLLCLPATRRAHFVVKLVVALLLGILLGGLMPWALESIGSLVGSPGVFPSSKDPSSWQKLEYFSLIATGLTLVSFYASTLTRNLLQALGAAVVVGIALFGFATWAINHAFEYGNDSLRLWVGPLVIYIGLPTLLAVLLRLAFKNYQRLLVGWNFWLRNLRALSLSIAFIVIATTLIYNRAWELLMTLEPHHGPARLSGSVRPKVCVAGVWSHGRLPDGRFGAGNRIFVLLPDGRLWVMNNYQFQDTGEYTSVSKPREHLEKLFEPVPLDGIFLGASNWVNLAASFDQVVGIQSDGSLWKIFSTIRRNPAASLSTIPEPERIRTDSDWRTVSAGNAHFLALKENGTLWGWGNNFSGQLGVGPEQFANYPVRIGTNSDWVSIFASGSTSIGVKRDGSVWKWGEVSSPTGQDTQWKSRHPEPVPWNLEGTNWLVFARSPDLAIQRNGTLWAMGNLPANLLGTHLFDDNEWRHFVASPLRVGSESDWSDIVNSFGSGLLALTKNGTLLQSHVWDLALVCWGREWKPSKYSDWIAIANNEYFSFVTLAADGTLSSWGDPVHQAYKSMRNDEGPQRGILGPSRKPLWSANIFGETKKRDSTNSHP